MKNKFEKFKEEICSNCKNKEKEYCKIVERIDNTVYERIDNTVYCEFYERIKK